MKEHTKTRVWELYERGRDYNCRLTPNQYDLVRTNTEFFIGNQWLHLPDTPAMRALPKPTFNILKRVASLFVASLTSSGVALRFEPLAYYDGAGGADPHGKTVEFANAEIRNLMDRLKLDYRIRDALFDGAQTGDYCAHFWFDPQAKPHGGMLGPHRGEICMELVDGINVMFGNPNDRRVETQPYILLVGRDTVASLAREAERHGNRRTRPMADAVTDWDFFPTGGVEAREDEEAGKTLYGLLYTKVTKLVDGREVTTVHATKATRDEIIFRDVDTGLSRYPVAWGNWEKQKGQYHGRALVTGMVPNQIFINTMFATAMRHLQLMAFPKTVYNADLIPVWSNEVGQTIGVSGLQPGQSVGEVACNLQSAEMSGQIFTLIDKAMAYTKECLGATDAVLGSAHAENTSALMVLQTNAEVPLENVRAGLHEWVEDIGAILLDLMGTYYGCRPVVMERELREPILDDSGIPQLAEDGSMRLRTVKRRVVQEFDFSRFKELPLSVRAEAGASTYFSEIAMTQTLDNLRRDGTLDLVQYLERIPDKLIPKKEELLQQLREGAVPETKKSGGSDEDGALLASLPAGLQGRYGDMSVWARRGLQKAADNRTGQGRVRN